MKLLIFMFAVVLTASCSSKKKVEPVATPEVVKQETTKMDEPAVTPAEPPASEPAPTPSTGSNDLPEISGESIQDVNCALGTDQRTISLLKRSDAAGWGVVYEKFGTKKTIAIAKNDQSFCEEVVARVKANLQNAGFQCDGEGSAMTSPARGRKRKRQRRQAVLKFRQTAPSTSEKSVEEKSLMDKAQEAAKNAKESAGAIIDKTQETVKETVQDAKGDE